MTRCPGGGATAGWEALAAPADGGAGGGELMVFVGNRPRPLLVAFADGQMDMIFCPNR